MTEKPYRIGQEMSFKKSCGNVVTGVVREVTAKTVVLENCSDGKVWHVGINWIFCMNEGDD